MPDHAGARTASDSFGTLRARRSAEVAKYLCHHEELAGRRGEGCHREPRAAKCGDLKGEFSSQDKIATVAALLRNDNFLSAV